MKVNRVFLIATAAVISAVAIPSCTYQPHYSNPSYASGYGYGYGSRNFTTTYFVRTSNSRWGYDPYARCYYDYSRRSYYDPYLNGYYPVGYRPAYVYGTPHPHGWSTGRSYISPPSHFHDHRLDNYQNRSERYRSLNNAWSRNIQTTSSSRSYDSNRDRYSSHDQNRDPRSGSFFGSSQGNQAIRNGNVNQNTHVNHPQQPRRPEPRMIEPRMSEPRMSEPRMSEPRMSEPKRESSKPSREEKVQKEDKHPRPEREANPNKERGGRKSESSTPEAMRQPEIRNRSQENRRSKAPSKESLEMVNSFE